MASQENHELRQNENENSQPFISDSQKLVQRHLADPNHEITEEDMQNIRVGMAPPPDAPTQQAIEEADERVADRKSDKEDDTIPGAQKITPWDVVD